MRLSILTGRINPARLLLDPPLGNNEGGSGGTGNQQPPANQQQQQQQPPAAPADPFASIDLDMQPDHIRQAITSSREALQRLQTEAQQGSQARTEAQQLQQQIAQLQSQVQQATQRQQTPLQNNEPQTAEQELEAYYVKQGLPADKAKEIARMNAGAFEIQGKYLQQQIGQQMGPIAGRVVQDTAQDAFRNAVQNDRVGWAQVPELQQALWDKTTAMAAQGQIVNPAVVENLAKILWFDHTAANGPTNIVPIQNQQYQSSPHSIPVMNQNFQPQPPRPQFSFPGAGNVVMPRNSGPSQGSPIDADTAAALAATTGAWPQPLQAALKAKGGGR